MKKLPYEVVAAQMEILWSVKIDPSDIKAANEHCDFMRNFVESSGWSIDDYIRRMMNTNYVESN